VHNSGRADGDPCGGAVRHARWRAMLLLPLLGATMGCSSMGTRYLELGLPVAYENAETLIGWEADSYLDLDRAQRDWLDRQVASRQAWHRKTQLPRYAATLTEVARAAEKRPLAPADLQRIEATVRSWLDDTTAQGLGVAAELFAKLSDAQVEHFRAEIEALNRKTAEKADDETPAERQERQVEQLVTRYEDMLGDLTPAQLRSIEQSVAAMQSERAHRMAYWRRWQGELFALLARRRMAPDCFAAQFTRMAMDRERWYTPELRAIRAHNGRQQRELMASLLTGMTPAQRQHFAKRADDWAKLFADLSRKRTDVVAQAQPAPDQNACRDTAVATHGRVPAET
jgi:hypothetical protein